jgi:uncharacterized repeat protein (TIGR01451 family)
MAVPSPATGVSVTDNLPAGYSLVSATPSAGTTWTSPTWTIGAMANGGNATLTIVATVLASGPYANTATITGIQTDPVLANNTSTVTPAPVPITDLSVVKTVDNLTPNVGSNVTFTITAHNGGPSPATGVSVTDNLPAGYSVVTVTPSAGTTWTSPTWTIGAMANGGNATLTIVATVLASGPYANTATITGTQTDPVACKQYFNCNHRLRFRLPILSVVKTVDNPTPNVGSNVTFTITAHNGGPSPATGVSVTDNLPAGYSLVSATPSAGTTWTSPTWTIGAMANGGNATLTIVATVLASGPYANTATITGTQTDPVLANNTSTVTPAPVPITDLSVVKTVDNPTPNVGSNVTFTITAHNGGPSPATGVSVTDNLPAGYSLVSATPSAGTTWTSPTWTIGAMANGGNATLTIVATVLASGPYANTATITGTQTDPVTCKQYLNCYSNTGSDNRPFRVVKTVNNLTPNVGSNVTFTITATNNGPSPATGVSVTDNLPAGYSLVSANPISRYHLDLTHLDNRSNGQRRQCNLNDCCHGSCQRTLCQYGYHYRYPDRSGSCKQYLDRNPNPGSDNGSECS